MKTLARLFAAILVLLSTGCAFNMVAERDRLMMTGRFGELQKHVEEEIQRTGDTRTAKLFPLCASYSASKRYDKLFDCCDRLEANIQKGDKSNVDFDEMARNNPLIGGLAKAAVKKDSAGDVSAFPFIMRAQAYMDLGQYGKAVEQARKAYEAAPSRRGSRQGRPVYELATLGLAYALNGNAEDARRTARELEGLDMSYPHTLMKTDQHVGLAKIYLALGEYERAIAVMERDDDDGFRAQADFWTGASMKGESMFVFQQLPKLFMLNKSRMETGRIAEAKKGYDDLLKIPQSRQNGSIYWILLFDRGRIAEKEGRLPEAIALYRQAVDVIEQQRATINTEASKIGFVGDKQSVYQRLVSTLQANNQSAEAFEYVERSKSRALVDMLAAKKDFSAPPESRQQVQTLLAAYDRADAEGRVQDELHDSSRTRSIAVKTKQDLKDQAPELASLVQVTSLSAREIQVMIPPDETVIEYYYTDRDLFAFVLTSQKLAAVRMDLAGMIDDTRRFRKLLETPGSVGVEEASRGLYRRLFQPLAKSVATDKLVIVPHGVLHYLPFNALYDGDGYMIDKYKIRVLPSAGVLRYLQTKKAAAAAGNILALGNPDLGNPEYDLKYAQAEAHAVVKTLPQSRALLRKDATETALRKYGGGFRYLHLATHGRFDADAPLKSALMLTPDSESDGLLTVDKLYTMRLQAELVTLSACETGLGKIAGGDDVVGLTRGFLYAGASSIVASLWKVDDRATSDLMTRFYSALQDKDKGAALRQAQLDTKKRYPHPFYWAAFQLTGRAQ
jgi:CHAT domain-containing protein